MPIGQTLGAMEEIALAEAACWGDLDKIRRILNSLHPIGVERILNTPLPLGGEIWEEQCTALMIAILEGRINVAEELINNWPVCLDFSEGCNYFAPGEENHVAGAGFIENITALWCAAYKGNVPLIELLLSKGANINCRTKFGSTPLRTACMNGRLDAAKILLEKEADYTLSGKYGSLPLHTACWSAQHGVELVKLLINKDKSCINQRDKLGGTPVFIASGRSLATLKILLEAGADLSLTDESGKSCLMRAADKGKREIVEFLVDHNTQKINAQTRFGKTALHMACENGHIDVAIILLRKGANMNVRDRDGKNFLMCASELKQLELVKKLLNSPTPIATANSDSPDRKISRSGDLRRADSQCDETPADMCVVCKCDPATFVLLPCRHLCCCENCFLNMKKGTDCCPLCHKQIESTLEIFRP